MKTLKELYEQVLARIIGAVYSEKGQTLVEYALILVLLVIVVIAALQYLAPKVSTQYCVVANKL